MKRRLLQWIFSGLSLWMVAGCGDEVATPGAQIVGPEDTELTVIDSPGFLATTSSPLEFQVFQPGEADETKPMPGATVRYFGGDQVVMLTDRERALETIDTQIFDPDNALNPDDPVFFETQTDDRGLSPTDIYPVFFVPQCQADPDDPSGTAGPDIDVTGTVTASIGVDSDTWAINITVKGGLALPNGPCSP